jgi:hypothetical protein
MAHSFSRAVVVVSCLAGSSLAYLPNLPFHDGLSAGAVNETQDLMDKIYRNPDFSSRMEMQLNGTFSPPSPPSQLDNTSTAHRRRAGPSYVYNNMELLRQFGLNFCGADNLGAWSTGTQAAGDQASKVQCSNGAWKGFSQFACMDSLTNVIDIQYSTAVKTASSPSDVHTFNDNNCKSDKPIHREFSQSISTTNQYDWSNTVALQTSNTLSVTAGVPGIIKVKDSFTISLSLSTTTSNSQTKTDTTAVSSSYDIPAHSKENFQVVFAKTNYNLPYVNKVQFGGNAVVLCKNKVQDHYWWFPTADYFIPKYSYEQITCSGGSSPVCALPGVFSAVSGTDYSTTNQVTKC